MWVHCVLLVLTVKLVLRFLSLVQLERSTPRSALFLPRTASAALVEPTARVLGTLTPPGSARKATTALEAPRSTPSMRCRLVTSHLLALATRLSVSLVLTT